MLERLKNKLFQHIRVIGQGMISKPILIVGHFDAMIIIQATNKYLRYCLSYRDSIEQLSERGIKVDHSTINRWILKYAPKQEKRLRNFETSPIAAQFALMRPISRLKGKG